MPKSIRIPLLVVAALILVPAGLVAGTGRVLVTNANDAGPGSFRSAVEEASGDPSIGRIEFAPGGLTVVLSQTVVFSGVQSLAIEGHGATLDAAGLVVGPAFQTTGGGSLALSYLVIRNSPGDGVAVDVPSTATGTIHVALRGVQVLDNKGHGFVVNDQDDPSTTDGVQPNASGSSASLDVEVLDSRFERNGYSVSDRDGLRVNEGGDGTLTLTVQRTVARDNAADGIEIDERGPGDVVVLFAGNVVTGNGSFDPADLDDGFDIDEYDDGSVRATIVASVASRNYEEGFDFNENNAGDMRIDLRTVSADGNGEEGIDLEEDDDFAGGGDLAIVATTVVTNGNGVTGDGDAGLKIREKGDGNLVAAIDGVKALENLIGGISVREDAGGSLVATVSSGNAAGNAGNGLDFDENGAGDLDASVSGVRLLDNAVDLRADEASDGSGSLRVNRVTYDTLSGNVAPVVVP